MKERDALNQELEDLESALGSEQPVIVVDYPRRPPEELVDMQCPVCGAFFTADKNCKELYCFVCRHPDPIYPL